MRQNKQIFFFKRRRPSLKEKTKNEVFAPTLTPNCPNLTHFHSSLRISAQVNCELQLHSAVHKSLPNMLSAYDPMKYIQRELYVTPSPILQTKTKAGKLNMPEVIWQMEELELSPRLANSSAFSECLNGGILISCEMALWEGPSAIHLTRHPVDPEQSPS